MKVAHVFQGGNALGSFHAGAASVMVPALGGQVYAGTSTGALVAAVCAQDGPEEAQRLYRDTREDGVRRSFSRFRTAWRLLRGHALLSFDPLWQQLQTFVRPAEIAAQGNTCIVGAVRLADGHVTTATEGDAHFLDTLYASCLVPGVADPHRVLGQRHVDRGVRDLTPIGDVLPYEPSMIVIYLVEPKSQVPAYEERFPIRVVNDLVQTFRILMHEAFLSDLREFERRNVQDGYRAYRYLIVEPARDLGPSSDFSRAAQERRIIAGKEAARRVLERVEAVR